MFGIDFAFPRGELRTQTSEPSLICMSIINSQWWSTRESNPSDFLFAREATTPCSPVPHISARGLAHSHYRCTTPPQHPYPPVENRGELSPLTPKAHFHDNEIAYCYAVSALAPRLGIEPKFGGSQPPVLSSYTTLGI